VAGTLTPPTATSSTTTRSKRCEPLLRPRPCPLATGPNKVASPPMVSSGWCECSPFLGASSQVHPKLPPRTRPFPVPRPLAKVPRQPVPPDRVLLVFFAGCL
jgi:hypothetical protein